MFLRKSYGRILVSSTRRQQQHRIRTVHNVPPIHIPSSFVEIIEVSPRDGLQNEIQTVSVQDRVTLINKLIHAGCKRIEVGSFVSSKVVPKMVNTDEVLQQLDKSTNENVKFSCLVPTIKYMKQAIQYKPDEIAIFASASEAFSKKNINCTIQESIERFRDVVEYAKDNNISVRGYLSCVIACPYQGRTPPTEVGRIIEQLLNLGCYEISLGDTIGVGTPASTIKMLDTALWTVGDKSDLLAVHFHDTYGQALANILVSLERGISKIDSSVAGLGGCPYAKGASGNVATEDVVYMLNGLGVDTGIDIDKLVSAGEFICQVLGRPSASKAGTAISAKRNNTTKKC